MVCVEIKKCSGDSDAQQSRTREPHLRTEQRCNEVKMEGKKKMPLHRWWRLICFLRF
jgi:hypothetical protein